MQSLKTTKQFERDLRRARRRGKMLDSSGRSSSCSFEASLCRPVADGNRLSGEWNRLWECHVEPDWLLIWDEAERTLTLVRTGTHADLFE